MISAPRRRRTILIVAPASAALVAILAWAAASLRTVPGATAGPPGRSPALAEGWDATSDGDFEERSAGSDGTLFRFRAATRGSRPDTVKALGARRRQEIRLTEGAVVAVDVDWNRQANGSGLSAAVVLSPDPTSENPLQASEILKVEYIGVPPGANARLSIETRVEGHRRPLFAEGWPDVRREGRPIAIQRVRIVVGPDRSFRVLENDVEVYASPPGTLPFEQGYLYLQVTSRANYPPREICFDNVTVTPGR